jgi:hypothetical protein
VSWRFWTSCFFLFHSCMLLAYICTIYRKFVHLRGLYLEEQTNVVKHSQPASQPAKIYYYYYYKKTRNKLKYDLGFVPDCFNFFIGWAEESLSFSSNNQLFMELVTESFNFTKSFSFSTNNQKKTNLCDWARGDWNWRRETSTSERKNGIIYWSERTNEWIDVACVDLIFFLSMAIVGEKWSMHFHKENPQWMPLLCCLYCFIASFHFILTKEH